MDVTTIRRDVESGREEMVSLRRAIHQQPEIGLALPKTQAAILEALDGLGLEISTGRSLSSVTAVLRGNGEGAAVLLRGDMDALPITEDTGLPFASVIDGAMHACGHDMHTAMLVGAAKVLAKHRNDLTGDIVFMFQPGEEGYNGASLMIEEGVLDAAGQRVSAAYGLHVKAAGIPTGVFSTRPGTLMASTNVAKITLTGKGGHGSAPHLANDPIPAAAALVGALQTMVTRKFNIFDPVVVTIGLIQAGTKNNIIPESARIEATIRCFSPEARTKMTVEFARVAEHVGLLHDVMVSIEYQNGYPVTVNDPGHAKWFGDIVTSVLGAERFLPMANPMAAAEDFSYVLENVPGCYAFLGAESGEDALGEDNHSARVVFDERVLTDGVLLHTMLALERFA